MSRDHSGIQIQSGAKTIFFNSNLKRRKCENNKQKRRHHNGDKNEIWLITNEIVVDITPTKCYQDLVL